MGQAMTCLPRINRLSPVLLSMQISLLFTWNKGGKSVLFITGAVFHPSPPVHFGLLGGPSNYH